MKITKSQLKQIIKEELEDTLNEEDAPSFKEFLGFLGLGLATIAGGLGPVYSAIPDSSPEDSTEEVLKDQAAERLVDMGPEKAEQVINKFGAGDEEIKDVFSRYNNKVRAAGGYTDEPNLASSWKENKMKITKAQLNKIVREEIEKKLDEGIMDTLKSAGSAVKKAFTGDKLPPLGFLHVGTKKTRDLDKIAMEQYKSMRRSGSRNDWLAFRHVFLGLPSEQYYKSVARNASRFDPQEKDPEVKKAREKQYYKAYELIKKKAAQSRSIHGSSHLFQKLRTLASPKRDRTLDLGQEPDTKVPTGWPGGVNPLEKKNYAISPDTARSILNNNFFTYVEDLDQSDIDGYVPPGYGNVPAEEEEIHKVLSEAPNREFVGPVDELPDAPMGGDVPGASEHQYDLLLNIGLKNAYDVAIKMDREQDIPDDELLAAKNEIESYMRISNDDYIYGSDSPSSRAYTAGASEEQVRQIKNDPEYIEYDMIYNLYKAIKEAMR
jgi:hypothetical protein